MNAQITLIKKDGSNAVMSKRISLDEHGQLKCDGSDCLMISGTATRVVVYTAADFAKIISACDGDQAIALGALKDDHPSPVPITTKARLKGTAGAIARTREYIDYRPGESGWALIDYDTKGMPAHVAAQIEAANGSWNALLRVAPGLQKATRVSRASTSAGVVNSATGEQFSGSGGAHHYILVQDAGDIERSLRDLHDRCWLHGLGWHVIGGAGQLLDRSIVDRMVAYGERLCFEGAPVMMPPLEQDLTKRKPEEFEGEAIDTTLIVPRLTEYEQQRVNEAKAASATMLGKAAAEIRNQHDHILAKKLSAKSGMPPESALRLVRARHRGVLLPFVELDFDHLGMMSVDDVLADPERFVGETLADPLEGVGYGRCKAMVMKGDDGGLFIHSFAHGRSIYYLKHDARSANAAIAQSPTSGMVDYAMAIFNTAELEPDEVDDFAETLSKAAKIAKRAVMERIAKERRTAEQAKRKAASASNADARPVRPRPQPDGELTPTVTYLDQMLAADPREDPPMRDASGDLVEVRVREPWNLHRLTVDGTNDEADDVETIKAPAEPALAKLSHTCVVLLVEKYVRWLVETKYASYFAALPRQHVDALMQLSQSAIPIVRAINTAPLVAMSGVVIEGVGLDRATGLFHRIDPLLRGSLPKNPPTEQEVRDAVEFLSDEWLVDVALDPVGKCIAIMVAMTLIERALLTERPAFFIVAGQRGGGKTTLIGMIVLAVLGRRAAAAAWSGNVEERKKALFSYLRQGVACLVWDNIARGSAISCPQIEAALTTPEICDRVLGVSRVETAQSTTVHIFTGNAIMPRGDMASRSLMLALNVDRPDPENRPFAHEDPFAWTQDNRPKIVRALYTLLIAGALNRPKPQEAKTRFKTWWSLVGWPMEYAAGLCGISLDCTTLMRSGEAGDEEASALSAALSALHKIWEHDTFTAKDVFNAMNAVVPMDPKNDQDYNVKKEQADALVGALGELARKPFEQPTAHSIGKIFQAHLVGRPSFIEDGHRFATLRSSPGHNANEYEVEVSAPGQPLDAGPTNTFPAGDPGSKHSPQSPHSPSEPSGDGESGNDEDIAPDFPDNGRAPLW